MWSRRLCVKFQTSVNLNCSGSTGNGLVLVNIKFQNISTLRGVQVDKILKEIKARDGLAKFIPHVEYLMSSSKDVFTSSADTGNSLDISDKTQLILQSAHPVRYVIEREIRELDSRNSLSLKYLDWVTIFGRSLMPSHWKKSLTATDLWTHEDKLSKVGTAAECGMFSADIHQTVINIPANFPPGKLHSEFTLGNKYAVLVGDFFAVKTIFFAEKVKSSPVFLGIIRGVEDYTYSSFASNSNLLDGELGYPILPHYNARREDWINYSTKFMGYFTGGLNAAFILNSLSTNPMTNTIDDVDRENLQGFVANLALCLKLVVELNEFECHHQQNLSTSTTSSSLGSTRFFTSLPAILYQEKEADVFQNFRLCNSDYTFDLNVVEQVRQKIAKSSAIPESKEMLQIFAKDAQKFSRSLGKDEFYSQTLHKLLEFCI